MEEQKTPTTSDTEDVEAHGYGERPNERPNEERNADDSDVEAHLLKPNEAPVERPVE